MKSFAPGSEPTLKREICGVVRCEVGRALKPEKIRQHFRAFRDVMINVPSDNHLWAQVEQIPWGMDQRGIILPLTDAVIACCVNRVGAVVLT